MYRLGFWLTVLLLLLACSIITACTPCEPILSTEIAQEIEEALGYALAPTYLPKGFESANVVEGVRPFLIGGETKYVILCYAKYSPNRGPTLTISYPFTYEESDPTNERLELIVPEDAISETSINGETAFLFHGSWTLETLSRVAQLVTPINPEWDYESECIGIKFAFPIPNGETIWIWLGPDLPCDGGVSEQDIIRIAESVIIVD